MDNSTGHSATLTISNRLGLHVRPVQRFAEFARIFKCDVEVEIRGQVVPGKSLMKLMSLGGRYGDSMKISAQGEDARQCIDVLKYLADHSFFVEDNIKHGAEPQRHIQRLAHIAGCFDSQVAADLGGKDADAKDARSLAALGLKPTSRPTFQIRGEDEQQARAVLETLVRNCFYVEEAMAQQAGREAR